METHETILDAPLTTRLSRPSRLAVISSRLDFSVNVFFLFAWVLCLLGGIIDNDLLPILSVVHFSLGCYQFAGALVGAIRGQKPKLFYFLGILFYFALLAFLFGVLDSESKVLLIILGALIPLSGAVYYTKLSYDRREQVAAAAER